MKVQCVCGETLNITELTQDRKPHCPVCQSLLILPPPTAAEAVPTVVGMSGTRPSILTSLTQKHLPLQNETSYFILANVLDIVMTNILLRHDAIEANPFAAYFLHRWGFNGMIAFKMFLVAFICVLTQAIALRSMRYAKLVLISGIVIVGGVVAYSAMLYLQLTSGATSFPFR